MKKRKKPKPKESEQQKMFAKIDAAYERKAADMYGIGHERNTRWRIAAKERNLSVPPEDQW